MLSRAAMMSRTVAVGVRAMGTRRHRDEVNSLASRILDLELKVGTTAGDLEARVVHLASRILDIELKVGTTAGDLEARVVHLESKMKGALELGAKVSAKSTISNFALGALVFVGTFVLTAGANK
jgi:hypothetical protein